MSKRNNKQTIELLEGRKEFVVLSTGEIKKCKQGKTRRDNRKGLYKTFANARALINTNVTDVSKVRWCTLTYKENMTDTKRLYEDFKKFNQRFQYYCKERGYGKAEYIVMMEPQQRGAWHAHLLYIWQHKAPYISNKTFSSLWGHGFVKIKKLGNVDNVGAYLTAYLGDMELSEIAEVKKNLEIKHVEVEENGKKVSKAIVKGARLDLYPANFNMIRYSAGIKKPVPEMISQHEARKKVLGATKTFESAIRLHDSETNFESYIVKSYYNKCRNENQI